MWSIIIIVFAATLRAAVQANGFNATTTTTTTTGGGGGGGVSVETRLEYARDALAREMTTESKVDDDDDENDIDLLREQIERDVHPFKGKVTREMTRKAGTKYAEKNHRGFAFAWTGGELYLFSRRPSKAFNGHHERLIYAYLCDLCEVFGKTKKTVLDQHDFVDEAAEEDVLPPIEMALSTFDYNPPDEERLPVLCFCRDKEFPEETGCILHPGFGFRLNKIDETVYARREEFDRDFPWSKKDE